MSIIIIMERIIYGIFRAHRHRVELNSSDQFTFRLCRSRQDCSVYFVFCCCSAGNLHSLKIEVFTADPRRADSTETAQLCAEVQQAIPSRHTEQIQCKVSDTGKYIQGQWLRIMKNSKDLVICEVEIFESLPETSKYPLLRHLPTGNPF